MKTPEEYLENLTFNPNTLAEEVIDIIKQVQKETWNEAIDKAADSADADINFIGWLSENLEYYNIQEGQDYEVYVLKQSILKLKL